MTESRTVLIDAGLPAKTIIGALEHLGTDPADVDAVLITHEHVDHVKSVRAISRKCCNAFFYASRGTVESTPNFCHVPQERTVLLSAGEIVTASLMPESDNVYFIEGIYQPAVKSAPKDLGSPLLLI